VGPEHPEGGVEGHREQVRLVAPGPDGDGEAATGTGGGGEVGEGGGRVAEEHDAEPGDDGVDGGPGR
jgi:hypothetical protein